MKSAAKISLAVLTLVTVPATLAATPPREEILSFETHDGLTLQGILSLPKRGEGPFPGILLLHGSGLHDADHELDIPFLDFTRGRQEHFKKLARFLSKKGYAVLRFNKRGASFDHESDNPLLLLRSSYDDLVEDARNALLTLYAHPRVAAEPLIVWGWSEGTTIAPRLARDHPEVSLLVLMGPAARHFDEILHYQIVERNVDFFHRAADENRDGFVTFGEIDRLDGRGGVGSFYVHNLAEALYGIDGEQILAGAEINGFVETLDGDRDGRLSVDQEIQPVYETALLDLRRTIDDSNSVYEQTLFQIRPLEEFVDRVKTPIVLVQGEADNQTAVIESERLIAKLKARGRDFEALSFPGLGHSLSPMIDFYKDDGGLTTLDNPTGNVMKKRVMRTIEKAIRRNLRAPRR